MNDVEPRAPAASIEIWRPTIVNVPVTPFGKVTVAGTLWSASASFVPSGSTSLSSGENTAAVPGLTLTVSGAPTGSWLVTVTVIGTDAARPPGSTTMVVHDTVPTGVPAGG